MSGSALEDLIEGLSYVGGVEPEPAPAESDDDLAMDADAIPPELLAMDRNTVRTMDKDGRLHVALTNISKANVCPYLGHEIPGWRELKLDPEKVYHLFRDPEELAKAAHTFNNLPLLKKHIPVTARDHQPDLVVGSLGTDAVFEAPYLKNSLVVWAKDSIDRIEAELQKELSSAYYYRADMTPGEYGGVKYDGVMRDIVGNHTALVEDGRAGDDVVVEDAMPKTLAKDVKDANGQEHDAKGRFGSGGGSKIGGRSVEHMTTRELHDVIYPRRGVTHSSAEQKAAKEEMDRRDKAKKAGQIHRPAHETGQRKYADGVHIKGAKDRASTAMDSKETTMSKPVLTRKAALLQGALYAHLRPRLAQDAQINFGTILKGVGPKNFKSRKPAIAQAITKACEGKLAQDASLGDVVELLDSLDDVMPAEDAEEEGKPVDKTACDDDPGEKLIDFLTDKISADDLGQVKSMLAPPTAADSDEDDEDKPPAEDEEDETETKPAEDEEDDDKVDKAAMDAAIASATKKATADAIAAQKAIREAEAAVRPYVGELVAQDSADAVYRAAFKALGVDVAGVHASAFPTILALQPKPGARKEPVNQIAMDAKGVASFAERFPEAARIRA